MSLLPVPKNSLQNRLPPHPPNKAFDHNIKLCYSHTIVQGRKAIATDVAGKNNTNEFQSHHRSRPKGYCDLLCQLSPRDFW